MIADVGAAAESWPTWRYVWRLHRFRPKRQLINLAGVLVGWPAMLLPGPGVLWACPLLLSRCL